MAGLVEEYNLIGRQVKIQFKLVGPFSLSDLNKSYRQRSLAVHPDKGGNGELFNLVNGTYEYTKTLFEKLQIKDPDYKIDVFDQKNIIHCILGDNLYNTVTIINNITPYFKLGCIGFFGYGVINLQLLTIVKSILLFPSLDILGIGFISYGFIKAIINSKNQSSYGFSNTVPDLLSINE